MRARTDKNGRPILLDEQNRGRWDHLLIQRGLQALKKATKPGNYQLQAAIAACHARARTAEETDWPEIARLYGELAQRTGSPVVELNRAVALSRAGHPDAALQLVGELEEDLSDYPHWSAVQGDVLELLGRRSEARQAFLRAAELTRNEREREVMLARARKSGVP